MSDCSQGSNSNEYKLNDARTHKTSTTKVSKQYCKPIRDNFGVERAPEQNNLEDRVIEIPFFTDLNRYQARVPGVAIGNTNSEYEQSRGHKSHAVPGTCEPNTEIYHPIVTAVRIIHRKKWQKISRERKNCFFLETRSFWKRQKSTTTRPN